jgi:hypothetical protein
MAWTLVEACERTENQTAFSRCSIAAAESADLDVQFSVTATFDLYRLDVLSSTPTPKHED